MRGDRGLLIAAVVTTLLGAGPLLVAGLAEKIASSAGCVLNEGNAHPCFVNGHDLGETLYGMFVMGWLSLLTIWLLIPAIALWIAWAVTIARGRRTPAALPPASPR